jgi:peptide/nickel transport system substrate-binding protein
LFFWPGFDGLTWIDSSGKAQPGLAKAWNSTDGKTWTFQLRDDVKFHDGSPLEAEDVVRTFQYYQNPATAAGTGTILTNVDTIEAPDKGTVAISLKSPQPDYDKVLALALIVKGRAIDPSTPKSLDQYFASSPVGTGPYKLSNFNPKTSLEYVAMPKDFVSPRGPAAVQNLIWLDIPDQTTRVAAQRSGDILIGNDVSYDAVPSLRDEGFTVVALPPVNIAHLAINMEGGPLKDLRVRQALNYGVDKQSLLTSLRAGIGAVDSQLITQEVLGYNPDVQPFPFDPTKARQLLSDAGYADGFDLGPLNYWDTVFHKSEAEAVQASLAEIGVKVNLQPVEQAVFREQFYGPPASRQGLWAYTINWDQTFEADAVYRWWSSDTPADGGRRWTDQTFDDMYQKAKTTLDLNARGTGYQQMVKYFHDQAPVVYLWTNSLAAAFDPKKVQWTPGQFADMFTSKVMVL